VGLLLDGDALPGPEALVVEQLLRCTFSRVVLVVRPRPSPSHPYPARPSELRESPTSRLLYRLYERWDRSRFPAAWRRLDGVDVAGALAGIPVLEVDPLEDAAGQRLAPEALARIRDFRLDVAIRFGFGRLQGDALGMARHGVWSYRYGETDPRGGDEPYLRELVSARALSSVELEVLAEREDGRRVLCRGWTHTPTDLSIGLNRLRPCLLGSTFVLRKLRELHEEGRVRCEGPGEPDASGARGSCRPLTPRALAATAGSRLAGRASRRVGRALGLAPRVEHWRLGVRVGGSRLEAGMPAGTEGFRWIEAPRGHFYADPFLLERGGEVHCFFEDFDRSRQKGRLCCTTLDATGGFREIRVALEKPYHLSYPFVFEDGGAVHMIPESAQNGTVDLYRAVEFPHRWEKIRTLLEGPGLDSTLLRHAGLYWLFVTVREPADAGEQLLLFYSETLSGHFRFHRRNPVSADARSCRSAGPVLAADGRLIRQSQDCSTGYGRQLNFHRIRTLTPDEYAEDLILTLPPGDGLDGIHTYGRCGKFEVLDGKRFEPATRHLTVGTGNRGAAT
jgi:hypothetical protein